MNYQIIAWTLIMFIGLVGADSLQHLIVFIRHGARAPLGKCEALDDKYNMHIPFNELSYVGQRQLYLLGKMYRTHYIEKEAFLSTNYFSPEIWAETSSYSRTVQTGYSFFLGLYSEGLEKMDTTQLIRERSIVRNDSSPESIISSMGASSQPYDIPVIPLIQKSKKYDIINSFESCPKFGKNEKEYYLSSFRIDYVKRKQKVFNQMCKLLDLNCSSFFTPKGSFCLDSLLAYHFDGLIPQLQGDLLEELKKIYHHMVMDSAANFNMGEKIMAYGFYKDILPQLEDIIYRNHTLPRVRFHFTHDTMLLSMLYFLKADDSFKKKYMPFASHIVFELRLEDGKLPGKVESYYLRILYNDKVIYSRLPFLEFAALISQSAQLNATFEDFCGSSQLEKSSSSSKFSILIIFFGILALFLFVIFATLIFKQKKTSPLGTTQLYGISSE